MTDHPIVLFDGFCNLCNGAVNFLIDHDPEERLRFGTLQDATVGIDDAHLPERDTDESKTIVFVEPEPRSSSSPRVTTRSDAILRIAAYLPRPWCWARFLRVIPRQISDVVYDVIARHRYRWFGKRDSCRVPTPDIAERFVDP